MLAQPLVRHDLKLCDLKLSGAISWKNLGEEFQVGSSKGKCPEVGTICLSGKREGWKCWCTVGKGMGRRMWSGS